MARKQGGRSEGGRSAKPVVLVVCEGETEFYYMNFIRGKYRASWLEPRLSDQSEPMGIIGCANHMSDELRRKGLDVDTWLVFDAESPSDERNRKYRDAICKALYSGMRVANSSPCFEYWVLAHFAPGMIVVEPREAVAALDKPGRIPGYKKPHLPYDELWERSEAGIPSKAMQKRRRDLENIGEDPRYGRPVSYVDELIAHLSEIQSR